MNQFSLNKSKSPVYFTDECRSGTSTKKLSSTAGYYKWIVNGVTYNMPCAAGTKFSLAQCDCIASPGMYSKSSLSLSITTHTHTAFVVIYLQVNLFVFKLHLPYLHVEKMNELKSLSFPPFV